MKIRTMQETQIKTSSKGQRITVTDGALCIDGAPELAATVRPLSASLVGKVPAGNTHICGRVLLTSDEARRASSAITSQIAEIRAALTKSSPGLCPRCGTHCCGDCGGVSPERPDNAPYHKGDDVAE